MALFAAILLAALPVLIARVYWRRAAERCGGPSEEQSLFLRWTGFGVVLPTLLWAFANVGLINSPPWPGIPSITDGLGAWHSAFNRFSFLSTLLICSYWAGFTFLWLCGRLLPTAYKHRDFALVCGAWFLVLTPLGALLLATGGYYALGVTMFVCCFPLVHATLNLKEEKRKRPAYAKAEARISFGRYEDAEQEIIRQLEEFENDFDGWIMLAELYATKFHDISGAHDTIMDLCSHPTTTPVQVSVALNRLADWHLRLARDPVRAQQALEEVCTRMPGTHMARMAQQRIESLPATHAELTAREAGRPVALPAVQDEFDLPARKSLAPDQAASDSNRLIEALTANPDDVESRESFARLLAEDLGRASEAIEQLELLLAMPGQAAEKRGRWLLLIAAWHHRHLRDTERARLVYEEIVRDFGTSAQAFAAQRRLHLLTLQDRIRRRQSALT